MGVRVWSLRVLSACKVTKARTPSKELSHGFPLQVHAQGRILQLWSRMRSKFLSPLGHCGNVNNLFFRPSEFTVAKHQNEHTTRVWKRYCAKRVHRMYDTDGQSTEGNHVAHPSLVDDDHADNSSRATVTSHRMGDSLAHELLRLLFRHVLPEGCIYVAIALA